MPCGWAATAAWRSSYATDLDAARQTLGDKLFAAAWAEGAAWTPEQAVAATTTPAQISVGVAQEWAAML
jgi:hypothetical protein